MVAAKRTVPEMMMEGIELTRAILAASLLDLPFKRSRL